MAVVGLVLASSSARLIPQELPQVLSQQLAPRLVGDASAPDGTLHALLQSTPLSSRYMDLLFGTPSLLTAALQWARRVSLWAPMRDLADDELWELLISANNDSDPTPPPWGAADACTLQPKCCAVYRCDAWMAVGLYEKVYDDAGMVSSIVNLTHNRGTHSADARTHVAPGIAHPDTITPHTVLACHQCRHVLQPRRRS